MFKDHRDLEVKLYSTLHHSPVARTLLCRIALTWEGDEGDYNKLKEQTWYVLYNEKKNTIHILLCCQRTNSGQCSWLQIQRSRVLALGLPESFCETVCIEQDQTQTHEDK
ncbi:unnamed protein product [Timema podura]|uniref:Uncharacterized protein n=1 Tax=Timema podura TaxID=61482 RepID=A0ABN7NNI0_TIMPD|nr:unnamed protein product [Timema podura]